MRIWDERETCLPLIRVFVTMFRFFRPLNGAGQSFLEESAMVGFSLRQSKLC